MLDNTSIDNPIRIIIADDNDLVRDVVRDLIELGLSAACSTAPTLEEAVEIARQALFDLALLDYNMPGMDGLSGVTRMMGCNVQNVALLSGRVSSEIIDDAVDLGVSGFLPKTLDPAAIIAAVDAMCVGEKFPAQHFLNKMIPGQR